MDKRFWGFLIAVAVVLGGIFYFSNTNKAAAPGSSGKGTLTNHVEGASSSGVKLVEYGDFQCPACGSYEPYLEQVRQKYAGQVSFQFRNFPLYQIHPNAIAGARAAEAADIQGKYWQMHDTLYQNQTAWTSVSDPSSAFAAYAKSLGLDIAKFQTDYKSSAVNDRVQADIAEGNRLGVDSTPTFFLDGKKISNPQPTLEAFSKVIDAEIVKKGGTPVTTTPTPTPAAADPAAAPAAQ